MILDDFVMLGTTVPEPNSDGRVFVCSAGVTSRVNASCSMPLMTTPIRRLAKICGREKNLNPARSRPPRLRDFDRPSPFRCRREVHVHAACR